MQSSHSPQGSPLRSVWIGERSPTLVAALFHDPAVARRAAEALRQRTGLAEREVAVLDEHEPDPARRLEPEQAGIWRTLKRSHVQLGLAGCLLGVLFAVLLLNAIQWPAAVSSPRSVLLLGGGFGAVAGMLAAGLLTLRPDHDRVIRRVRAELARGGAAVVAHPRDELVAGEASAVLRAAGGDVVRSL